MKSNLRRTIIITITILTLIGATITSYAFGRVASNGVHIYVSKMQHTLTLYKGSSVLGSWDCSVGVNSDNGDKKQEGDKVTPSGTFYICTRNDQSVCYLSLGLSYPSKDDADRGLKDGIITQEEKDSIYAAIDQGIQPPWDTALGGEIMIHGNRHIDPATSGCVAVDNDVMDVLWQYCELKTPVEVGP